MKKTPPSVVAGLIRYGIVTNRLPVFFTEKPNLFSDIYRDLMDVGSEDGTAFSNAKKDEEERLIKYQPWEKLSDEEKAEYGDEDAYDQYIGKANTDIESNPYSEHKCAQCKQNEAKELHTCSYQQETNDDSESLCNCCDDCVNECLRDV